MTVMKWYAAHTLIGFQRLDHIGPISVFENIYIIRAVSEVVALQRAESISALEAEQNDDLSINGNPAKCVCCGVRKIVTISNSSPPQYESPPEDGSEISYIEYEVGNIAEFKKILLGDTGIVTLVE
jgi:hypothetical protein